MSGDEHVETPAPVRRAVRRRAVLAAGPAGAAAALVAALLVLLRDRLPWGPTWSDRVGLAVVGLVGALVVAGILLWRRPYMVERQRAAVTIVWVVTVLTAGWLVGLVGVTIDGRGELVADPSGWWTSTPVVVGAIAAVSLLAWTAAGPDPLPDPVRPTRWRAPAPTPQVWTRSYTATGDLGVAACLGATAVIRILPWSHNPELGWIAAVVGAWVLARSRLRLEADERGVRLVQPLLLRRCLLQVARVDVASVAVQPLTAAGLPGISNGLFWRGTQSGYRERNTGAVLCFQLTDQNVVFVTGPADLAVDRPGTASAWWKPVGSLPDSQLG